MKGLRLSVISVVVLLFVLSMLLGCQKQTSPSDFFSTPSGSPKHNTEAKPTQPTVKKNKGNKQSGTKDLVISSPSSNNATEDGKSADSSESQVTPDKEDMNEPPPKDDLDTDLEHKSEATPQPEIEPEPGPEPLPDYNVNSPYDTNKPNLMGLTINDTLSAVVQKFGKETSQYMMQDEADPITVHEYPGFTIGFSKANLIRFIDVSSSDVNPGLNGLRLGHKADDAIKAIGKPNTNTDFVLNYMSGGIILKLDIDPKSKVIHSIKLFADD